MPAMSAPLVLVVDDYAPLRRLLVEALASVGYVPLAAAGGAAALLLAHCARPSLVILDADLPVIDGWDLAAALQRCGQRPPILVLTAQSVRQRAAAINAAGYLQKPFELDELLALVARLCGPGRCMPSTECDGGCPAADRSPGSRTPKE